MFFKMSDEYIKKNFNEILCQYSNNNSLLYKEGFEPESFTAYEKLSGKETLFFNDISFDEWIGNMLEEQFLSGGVEEQEVAKAVETGIENFKKVLSICGDENKIYNQETVDILRRISSFTLFGNLTDIIETAKKFDLFAHSIIPSVIKKIKEKNYSLEEWLKISIISGLSGLDLKGATAAASAHKNDGIPMKDLLILEEDKASEILTDRIINEYEKRVFPLFFMDSLLCDVETRPAYNLVWMTDDVIETYFDLEIISMFLNRYSNLKVTLIPKNGKYGNDTSYKDIVMMLPDYLENHISNGRLTVLKNGPLMGAANLKKLSFDNAEAIRNADSLLIKGCRISEMFNGGTNVTTYCAYNIVRKVSEKLSGYSANDNISVFYRLSPGEYAFWGVKGHKNVFEQDRALSTLREHFITQYSNEVLINRFNSVYNLLNEYSESNRPICQELERLIDIIVSKTASNYNEVAFKYDALERRSFKAEQKKWNRLNNKVQEIYGTSDGLKLLDVGVGDGKGIEYAYNHNYDVWGCDISSEFISITRRKLPSRYCERITKCDMRSMPFENGFFDIVRHNATLVHMPIIYDCFGVDGAIKEARRVLKLNGLLYISLKIGNKNQLCLIDTNEGLGERIYQIFTIDFVEDLLLSNGFEIIDKEIISEMRNYNNRINWLNVICKRIKKNNNAFD